MSDKKPQEELISFAMKELTKVLEDVKKGKTPVMSPSMETLASELEKIDTMMSDEELDKWAERMQHITKNDEEE